MLKLKVHINGQPPQDLDVADAYLVGSDDQPVRAEIRYRGNTLFCDKRTPGLAALVLPWTISGVGRVMLSTALLQDREKPYNLQVELLRGRILKDWRKKDDWGYVYRGPSSDFTDNFAAVRSIFADALATEDEVAASRLAESGLKTAVEIGEALTMEHANRGLVYRRDHRELVDLDFGCWIEPDCTEKTYQDRLFESFNYATVPMDWRTVEPFEQEFQWGPLDYWVSWLTQKGIAIKAGQLLRFHPRTVPDWLYIWEGDFDSIRDNAFEHVLRCVQRYGSKIEYWDIATGLHVENCLKFSMEQIMELTHMGSKVIKKNAPKSVAVLDVVMPWGDYFGHNPRSLWPLKYVEQCLNAGIEFDAIGLQVFMGAEEYPCRDLMEVSSLLDQFGSFGKPLHVTAAGVPSSTEPDQLDASGGQLAVQPGGWWHAPWDQQVQSRWVDAFYHIAIGKPFVTSVCWTHLSDRKGHFFPHAGLLSSTLETKASYNEMLSMKKEIWPEGGIVAEAEVVERPWEQY